MGLFSRAPKSQTEAQESPSPEKHEAPAAPESRFARLKSRLGGQWGNTVRAALRAGNLDQDTWDQLEDALLAADVGLEVTDEVLAALKQRVKRNPGTAATVLLAQVLVENLTMEAPRTLALEPPGAQDAAPIVVVGVNGVGKTTTVGKLARVLVAEGYSVVMGAADTFRAAAADQLQTWGARVDVPVVRDEEGADPASVAFRAAEHAHEVGADVVLVDTAGRLQNKQGLMDELGKIIRVLGKRRTPEEVLLVLDATTGQNGLAQARIFAEVAGVTGVVLTKLDGSAKGGIVFAVQRALGVPVKFVGLGEGVDDVAPFDPEAFVSGVLGEE